MSVEKLRGLPTAVKEIVYDDRNDDINGEIARVCNLSVGQLKLVLGVLIDVIAKVTPVLQFPVALAKLNLETVDVSKVALEFALRRLWPLQDWLGDVDALIRRLGGDIPPTKPTINLAKQQPGDYVQIIAAQDFLSQASKRRYYTLSSDHIRDDRGSLADPTIEQWLKEYLRFAGERPADSLSRSEFMVKNK